MTKRVFIVGGTGFLGYHAIQEFIAKGWEVTALGLPPAPPAHLFPSSVNVVLQSLDSASDEKMLALLRGHKALVFAAGADDRFPVRRPAYPFFRHGNVDMPERVLQLAKKAGIQRAVALGSYFAHFNTLWPELELARRHPYIRSRMEQEQVVTSISGLDGIVLQLPYIFGALPVPGWESLWTPIIRYLRSAKTIFYMKGGTACVSAGTVGRAIVAAVERGQAGKSYLIGQENLSWTQMLSRLATADKREVHIRLVPSWLIKTGMVGLWFMHWLQGKEHGLDPRFYAELQMRETYLDAAVSQEALGYDPVGLDVGFRETVRACKLGEK